MSITLKKKGHSLRNVTLSIFIIGILVVSSIIPMLIQAGSNTTTLESGVSETNITFLPQGGASGIDFQFPYGADISNTSISLTGFPNGETSSLNHTSTEDFNGTQHNGVIIDFNEVSIMTWDNWWNSSWYYKIDISINSSLRDRKNFTPTLDLNLTQEFNDLGITSPFDTNSIRIIEHDVDGVNIKFNESGTGDDAYIIPYFLQSSQNFDPVNSINFTLEWTVKGAMQNNTTRFFSIYFDTSNRPKSPPSDYLFFRQDVVLLNQVPTVQDSYIYISNETGPDSVADQFIPTKTPYKFDIVDINTDGYNDLIIANSGTAPLVNNIDSSIFYGGPDGFSSTPDVLLPTFGAYAVKAIDINKDGFIDLVFANNHNGGNYQVNSTLFYGSANGFNSTHDHEFNTTGAGDVEIADFNYDGWLDFAFANYFDGVSYNLDSHVYLGGQNGPSSEPDYIFPTKGCFAVSSGDVNKDGIADLLLANFMDDTFMFNHNNTLYYGNASGFSLTPDLFIRGVGTYAIEIDDLNSDGDLDFLLGNAFDGASGDVDSFIYYFNASGNYQTPDVLLSTKTSFDTAIGDVNDDGFKDIAFANWGSGGSNNIDSVVFLGNASGYSQSNNIGLATKGGAGVQIADVDRYIMNQDSIPPVIVIEQIENKFVDNAFLISQIVTTEDDIRSVVASWDAVTPPGSTIDVFVSNDGGANWTRTNNSIGTVFVEPGRLFQYRIELTTNNETPVLHWINITYFMGNYPTNVTLDIGGDGDIEWTEPSTFNYTFTLNSSVIADELTNHTSPDRYYPWEYITVPMVFTSETSGIIHIYAINITHNSPPYQNSSFLLPDIKFNEDEARPLAFDLDDHFFDMDNDTLTYSFTGATNVNVLLTAENMVDLSAGPNWFGQELITFRAEDGDGGSVEDTIIVTVNPVNDPPVARIGSSSSNGTIIKNVTLDGANSTDIDGIILHYIWDFGDGNFGTGVKVSHEYDLSGDFVVKLTVIDDGGMAGTAEMTITKGNVVPVAKVKVLDETGLGFDTFVNVLIDMSGTFDPDGDIKRFHLDFGDGSTALRMDGAPPMTWEHQYRDGTYTYIITLTIWDNNNATAEDTATVTINNVEPEIVTVSAPSVATVGQRVKFNVLAEDQDGSVSTYMWDFVGDGIFGWSSDLNGNATHKYDSPGTYHATLKVVDDDGTSSFYRVTIEIKEDTKKEDVGMILGLGIALLVIVVILGYIIFQQRSRIMGQKALLVKRDEVLREMRLEQETEMETTTGEEIDRIAPAGKAEATEKEEEESDFEDVEEEGEEEGVEVEEEEEEDLGTLELMDEGEDDFEPDDIVREDSGEPTIRPLDSTGIMPTKPSKPPVPEGLGDMIGAAQVTPVVPVPAKTEEEEEEGPEEEEEEPEEEPVEERKPIAKARCPGCKALIPLYSKEKPMRIKCDNCGKEGVIK